jgi:hypothetical protein
MISTETKEVVVPEGAELIDDVFYIWKTKYGLYSSMTKQGRQMMTGLHKSDVTSMTRAHLMYEQDGTLDQHSRVVAGASMGVKL